MEDGSIVYAEDPQNYDTSAQDYDPERDQFRFVGEHEDPDGYYNAAVQKVHDAIAAHVARGGRNINICIDFYPKIVEQNGLPGNTDALVQSIHKLIVEDDRVDGIDIDWEYPTGVSEWNAYGNMLVAVDKDFQAADTDKYISLALSADNVRLTQEQIDAVDFVQMMAYDRFDITDGNHSSFRSGAYSSMRYFVNMGFDPSQQIDALLQQKAKERGMKVGGLETAEYQLKVLFGSPISCQAQDLIKMLRDETLYMEYTRMLADIYARQGLDAMLEMIGNSEMGMSQYELDTLLYGRNEAWTEKLVSTILPQASTFIVVGAGHLPGEKGVLSLLRKAGYTVTPVK